MTRRDYVRMAESIRIARQALETDAERKGFEVAVSALSDALKADNGRFDREHFASAAGGGA